MSRIERWMRKCQAALVLLITPVAFATVLAGCYSLPSPDAVSPLAPSSSSRGAQDLTLVHSNDTWGYLTPCG
jgi:hypothetical protein